MPSIHDLLDKLWADYVTMNPQALAIHELLEERGEKIVNDHIAFRTFDDPRIGVDVLAGSFESFGYEARGEYTFPAKKLFAKHYEHADRSLPKVFISELKLVECSPSLHEMVKPMIDNVSESQTKAWDFPVAGRLWDLSFADYETLAAESEYAGWLAAHGFRANHFTIDVGQLKGFDSLEQFNAFIKEAGFPLNAGGGEIKGSPGVFLEQSSTLAGEVAISFTNGTHAIPACYYEFARRYHLPDGGRFEGFIAASADKIFESTDRQS